MPLALSLFALGCPQPGELENANMYPPPPASGGVSCETDCLKAIINNGSFACKTCHSDTVKLDMGTLDMASPGLSARLKDQAAAHKGLTDATGCPKDDKIIDSAAPANSWLLKKVKGTQGSCGAVMPTGSMLSAADQTCVETFVTCVATGGTAMPGGGTGSTSGGSGGTAAGGGGSGGAAAGSGGSATGGGGSATAGSGGTGGA